ncbi:MAG: Gfo/Idh/MocA family oxidoreductase [Treponema sp.]|jgi:predicted dehydrogenase|nr:Gfo/Idh/MocA family oxidoreductase [Treponema sp.]
MDKVRLGVIGAGVIGTAHIKTILAKHAPDIKLTAAAESSPEKREEISALIGNGYQIFETADELIEKGRIDAVLIAVPHYQHPEIAVKAFEKGLHVLCEKPAGVYTKQVREMNEAAAKSGKVFAMMFNQRTNARYRKVRELVTGGSLGAIMRTSWIITNWFRTQAYYSCGGWRGTWNGEGGGVLLNQCPHQLDLFQWICGMPDKVRAFCHNGKWHNIEVEDDVTAYLEYPNGATGTFITSTGEAPGTNRLEISLEKGKIVCEGKDDLTVHRLETNLREYSKTSSEKFASPKCVIEKPEIEEENSAEQISEHAKIMRSFSGCILRGESLIAQGEEGINGLMLSNAMHLSSWLDKTIEIPFDEDLFLTELNKRRKI